MTACTVPATGIMNSMPERARSAKIVPELILFTYAFVSVFNIFEVRLRNPVYKADGQLVHFHWIPDQGVKECP